MAPTRTKTRLRQFAVQRIHIGKDIPFPIPMINIAGEITEDIALLICFVFELLAAAKGETMEDIYSKRKGFAKIMEEACSLNIPA